MKVEQINIEVTSEQREEIKSWTCEPQSLKDIEVEAPSAGVEEFATKLLKSKKLNNSHMFGEFGASSSPLFQPKK